MEKLTCHMARLKKGGVEWVGDEWEVGGQSVCSIPRTISERLQVAKRFYTKTLTCGT